VYERGLTPQQVFPRLSAFYFEMEPEDLEGDVLNFSLLRCQLHMHPMWHPIPYVVHYFQPYVVYYNRE
jgi:hypothetical protein